MKLNPMKVKVRGAVRWCVDIPAHLIGKRRRVFGVSREMALSRAEEILGERREFGEALGAVTAQERAFLLRWRGRIALAEMDAVLQASAAASEILLADAMEKYRAKKEHLSLAHRRDLKFRFTHFLSAVNPNGARALREIRAAELHDFLQSRGADANGFYRALRAFFRFAISQEWIVQNPLERLAKPEAGQSRKEIIAAHRFAELLRLVMRAPIARDGVAPRAGELPSEECRQIVLRAFVLGGLLGLRTSEFFRVRGEQIKDGQLYLSGLKTQKRGLRDRFVTIHSSAAAWFRYLEIPKSGLLVAVSEANFRKHRLAAIHAAGWSEWPKNALRKSFGSHHLAAFANAAQTASEMGHTSEETTFAKYRVALNKREGEAWFAITPKSALKEGG